MGDTVPFIQNLPTSYENVIWINYSNYLLSKTISFENSEYGVWIESEEATVLQGQA